MPSQFLGCLVSNGEVGVWGVTAVVDASFIYKHFTLAFACRPFRCPTPQSATTLTPPKPHQRPQQIAQAVGSL